MGRVFLDVLKTTGCILAVLGAGAVLLIALFVGYVCWYYTIGGPDAGKLEREIDKDLKPGASLEEIYYWLDTTGADRDIQYAREVHPSSDFGLYPPLESTPRPDTQIVNAIQRHDGSGLEIYFLLDEELRLSEIVVRRYDTLP